MSRLERIIALFGSQAPQVLANYRRAAQIGRTVESLEATIAGLAEQRDTLSEQHEKEITRRRAQVAEEGRKLEATKQILLDLKKEKYKLSRRIDSLWRRIGITLRRLFDSRTMSVKETRRRLEAVAQRAIEAENSIDSATRVFNASVRYLRRLTDPIDSLDYAVRFLKGRSQAARQETAELDAALDQAIRDAAKTVPLEIFARRFRQLADDTDGFSFVENVLRLKRTIAELEVLPSEEPMEEIAVDVESTREHLCAAIQAGRYDAQSSGQGEVAISGSGTTHVRKTRTVTDTHRNADGTTRRSTRQESYWDRVRINFSGYVRADFNVVYVRWQKAPVVGALSEQADIWFRAGAKHARVGAVLARLEELQDTVESLTGRIRDELLVEPERQESTVA